MLATLRHLLGLRRPMLIMLRHLGLRRLKLTNAYCTLQWESWTRVHADMATDHYM